MINIIIVNDQANCDYFCIVVLYGLQFAFISSQVRVMVLYDCSIMVRLPLVVYLMHQALWKFITIRNGTLSVIRALVRLTRWPIPFVASLVMMLVGGQLQIPSKQNQTSPLLFIIIITCRFGVDPNSPGFSSVSCDDSDITLLSCEYDTTSIGCTSSDYLAVQCS